MFQQLIHNKKYLLLFTIAAIILFGMIIMVLLLQGGNLSQNPANPDSITPSLSPSATPTAVPQALIEEYSFGQMTDETYIQNEQAVAPTESIQVEESTRVGALLGIVPYQGEYFSLDYNYDTFNYVLTLQRDFLEQGDEEFDEFLKDNGISDRTSLGTFETQLE